MSAYYILTQTVTNPQRYAQEYIPSVMPFLAKYKVEVVVAEMEATSLQGEPAKGAVVLRFPSEQAIRDFLSDPGYQPVKQIRLDSTVNANAMMAPEFKMPG